MHIAGLFISDLHLGGKACHVYRIFDFLARNEAEIIYLVAYVFNSQQKVQFCRSLIASVYVEGSVAKSANCQRIICFARNYHILFHRTCSRFMGTIGVLD